MRRIKSYFSSRFVDTSQDKSDVAFDISLTAAQFSSDVLANFLILLGPSYSPLAFTGFSTISVICSGAMPGMNSVGASLLSLREAQSDGAENEESADGRDHRPSRSNRSNSTHGRSGQLYGAMSVIASVIHTVQVSH